MSIEINSEVIQAWIQLHRAHRLLLDKVGKTLNEAGLPPLDWYDVLLELHREKNSGLRQFEIGSKILLNKYNLSRLIDRLEKNRLVERHACEEDGRGYRIKITAEGENMLKKVWPIYSQSIQENFADKLNSTELIALDRLLTKVLGLNENT